MSQSVVKPIFAPYILSGSGNGVLSSTPVTVSVVKQCRVATSSSLGLTYVARLPINFKDSFTGAPSTLSGVTLVNGDRVLVKNETDQSRNGIYIYFTSNTTLRRSDDWDRSVSPIPINSIVDIAEGTNAGTEWALDRTVTTVGTDPAIFSESGPSLSYNGSGGISIKDSIVSLAPLTVSLGGTGITTIGNDGQILVASSSAPVWGTLTSGSGITINGNTVSLTSPVSISKGGSGIGSLGTEGQVLTVTSGAITWKSLGTSLTVLSTVTSGEWRGNRITPTKGGTGLSTVGADGQILMVVLGSPAWSNKLTAGTGITILNNLISTDNSIVLARSTPTLNGLSSNNGIISSVSTPILSTDLATKKYADSILISGGGHFSGPCAAATTASLGGVYQPNTPVSTKDRITAAPPTIDGVTLNNGDRVLIKDQAVSLQNGIYTYNLGSTSFDRADDWDRTVSGTIQPSTLVFVNAGTANGSRIFSLGTAINTVGISPATFTLASIGTTYIAGTGINIVKSTINVNMTGLNINGSTFNGYTFNAVGGTPPVGEYLQTVASNRIQFGGLNLDGSNVSALSSFSAADSSFVPGNILVTANNLQAVFAPPPKSFTTNTSTTTFTTKTINSTTSNLNLDGAYFGTNTSDQYTVANSAFTQGNILTVDNLGNVGFAAPPASSTTASAISTSGDPLIVNRGIPGGYGNVLMSIGGGRSAWSSMFETGYYIPPVTALITGVGTDVDSQGNTVSGTMGSVICRTASWVRIADSVRVSGSMQIVSGQVGQDVGNNISNYAISFRIGLPILQSGFGYGGLVLPNMAHGTGMLTSAAPGSTINTGQARGNTSPGSVRIYVDQVDFKQPLPQVRFDMNTDGVGTGPTESYYVYYTFMYVLYTTDGFTTQAIGPPSPTLPSDSNPPISNPWGSPSQPPAMTDTTGFVSTPSNFGAIIGGVIGGVAGAALLGAGLAAFFRSRPAPPFGDVNGVNPDEALNQNPIPSAQEQANNNVFEDNIPSSEGQIAQEANQAVADSANIGEQFDLAQVAASLNAADAFNANAIEVGPGLQGVDANLIALNNALNTQNPINLIAPLTGLQDSLTAAIGELGSLVPTSVTGITLDALTAAQAIVANALPIVTFKASDPLGAPDAKFAASQAFLQIADINKNMINQLEASKVAASDAAQAASDLQAFQGKVDILSTTLLDVESARTAADTAVKSLGNAMADGFNSNPFNNPNVLAETNNVINKFQDLANAWFAAASAAANAHRAAANVNKINNPDLRKYGQIAIDAVANANAAEDMANKYIASLANIPMGDAQEQAAAQGVIGSNSASIANGNRGSGVVPSAPPLELLPNIPEELPNPGGLDSNIPQNIIIVSNLLARPVYFATHEPVDHTGILINPFAFQQLLQQ